ncbi:MAG TPA: ribonuclease HI family protein [Candidatus Paceibacterota bacterium]
MERNKNQKIIIYADGGSRGNPGEAAIGFVIADEKGNAIKKHGERLGVKTNNEAEYAAVIAALKKAKALFGKEKTKTLSVEVRMDSELVVRQLTGKYKIQEERLFPLFIAMWNLQQDFASISFTHIPREQNKEADRLVNEALDQRDQKLL